LEAEAKMAYEGELTSWNVSDLLAEEQAKITVKEIAEHLKNNQQAAAKLLAEGLQAQKDARQEPQRKRYVVNDPSVEKLGELLAVNNNGLLLFRDELSGFLRSLDREDHANARSFYLESWNGTGSYSYDRIVRGTIDIEHAIMSILGSIQPGPLGRYLREALQRGEGQDGLVQRFQGMVWPDIPKPWKNID